MRGAMGAFFVFKLPTTDSKLLQNMSILSQWAIGGKLLSQTGNKLYERSETNWHEGGHKERNKWTKKTPRAEMKEVATMKLNTLYTAT